MGIVADWDGALYEKVNGLQRWLAARSLAGLELRGDERLLDVGCGDGQVTALLAARLPTGSVLGIDASPRMVDTAREHAVAGGRLEFDAGDVLSMPFVAEFDVIVSFNVLHWVHDQRRAFARIGAALRPGGWALLQFVCGGSRPSLEATAMQICETARWRGWFHDFPPPFVHPAPDEVRATADAAGLQHHGAHGRRPELGFRDADRLRPVVPGRLLGLDVPTAGRCNGRRVRRRRRRRLCPGHRFGAALPVSPAPHRPSGVTRRAPRRAGRPPW